MLSYFCFLIRRFIPADKEEVEQTRILLQKEQKVQQQQRQQETELEEGRSNSEFIKGKKTITKSRKSAASDTKIDIEGAITLAVAITSFLLVLTYLEMGSGNNNNNNNNNNPIDSSSTIAIASFIVAGIISIALFILIENRSAAPLIDFGLMLNKRILLANIIIMIVGFSMFIVFQTIPILVQNPRPVGFGGDPISAAKAQLAVRSYNIDIWISIRCDNHQVRVHEDNNNGYCSGRHRVLCS